MCHRLALSPPLYLPEPHRDAALCMRAAALLALSLLPGQIDSSGNHWLLLLSINFSDDGVGLNPTVCVNGCSSKAWERACRSDPMAIGFLLGAHTREEEPRDPAGGPEKRRIGVALYIIWKLYLSFLWTFHTYHLV